MSTLLLRLSGPMQAWGTQSRFRDRDTGREPSKSGVIGLLCAALGRPRDAELTDLVALRMGVRVDNEGVLMRDFQTSGAGYPKYNKAGRVVGTTDGILSPRYYLAGASFLVGLEGDSTLLHTLDAAVRAPVWQIFLGRKAMPPTAPIACGLVDLPLHEALRTSDLPPEDRRMRLVLDTDTSNEVRNDVPLSFAHRRFASRSVETSWMETPS